MANFSVRFFSNSLQRTVSFIMYIPNDKRPPAPGTPVAEEKPMKTLFLLHGYTGDGFNWIAEDFLEKYNLAVVMPSGENSFYLDGLATGHKFGTFLGIELVDYVRKTFGLAKSADDTYVMGFSMGGYGAIHTALAYPDRFSKAYGLSSALIVHGIAHMKETDENPVANYAYYHECFGDLETVEERDTNPEVQIKNLKASGTKIPDLYIACGTEDFLIEPNRVFHDFLDKEGVEHVYRESKGVHDMVFWKEYTEKFIEMSC